MLGCVYVGGLSQGAGGCFAHSVLGAVGDLEGGWGAVTQSPGARAPSRGFGGRGQTSEGGFSGLPRGGQASSVGAFSSITYTINSAKVRVQVGRPNWSFTTVSLSRVSARRCIVKTKLCP